MNRVPPTICPYTLKPFAEIKVSEEHVIPDALGGPAAFSVIADEHWNGLYGSGLDADFVNDDLMKAAAQFHNVKTRSGKAKLAVKGQLTYDKTVIAATVDNFAGDSPTIYPDKPVTDTGNCFEIIADDKNFAKLLATTIKNNASKGLQLQPSDLQKPGGTFHGRIEHSFWKKTLGLVKVGYLSLAYSFGDDFIRSSAGAAFRKAYESTTKTELNNSGLDITELLFRGLLPPQSSRHKVAAVRDDNAYAVYVSLFEEQAFTRQFSFPANQIKLQSAQGLVYEVDAVRKKFTFRPFDAASDQ